MELLDLQLGHDVKLEVKLEGINPVLVISGNVKLKGVDAQAVITISVGSTEVLELIKGIAPGNQLLAQCISIIEGALAKVAAPIAPPAGPVV